MCWRVGLQCSRCRGLHHPLYAGVCGTDGTHAVLTSGSLWWNLREPDSVKDTGFVCCCQFDPISCEYQSVL